MDGQVLVESSDKMQSTGEGKGKALQYSCLENPMNSMVYLYLLPNYLLVMVTSKAEKKQT